MKPKKRIAIGYTRVSTNTQAEEGVSLEMQKQLIEEHAEKNNLQLAKVYCDAGESGRTMRRRKELKKAIRKVCAAKGVLVIYSLSRLARSSRDAANIAATLDESKADIVSCTEAIDTTTAIGKCFFAIMAAVAQFESDQTGERVKDAMRHKFDQLGYHGHGVQRFGLKLVDGKRQANYEEEEVIDRIIAWRGSGLTTREIASRLNRLGIETLTKRRGYKGSENAQWSGSVIHRLLQRMAPELCAIHKPPPAHRFTGSEIKLLGTMADAKLAKKLGCPRHQVTNKRLALRIAAFSPKNSPASRAPSNLER